MPQEPQDYPDPYAGMGTGERLAELARGAINLGKYQFNAPSATQEHLDSPEIFARMLRERYPELGKQRVNRGALDAAINFAGGYDWAMRPEVTPEDARAMALQYQLLDYMLPGKKGSDEAADYAQNMAGVEQALADRAKKIKREREDIAALARQYAQQEAEQGRVRKAEGGAVRGGYDPARVQSIVDRLEKMFSLDEPKDMSAAETATEIAAGFVPGVGTAQAARDFERARRAGDKLDMILAAASMLPVAGGAVKPAKYILSEGKDLTKLVDKYLQAQRDLGKAPVRVRTTSELTPLYHSTNATRPILSTSRDRFIPESLSATDEYAGFNFGKNIFQIPLPENTKYLFANSPYSIIPKEYVANPLELGKEFSRLAKEYGVDVAKIRNVPGIGADAEWALMNPELIEYAKFYRNYDDLKLPKQYAIGGIAKLANGGRPKLPADRATGFKQPGAVPDDRLARFGSSFVSSLPGAASNVATGYVDMLSALNNYLYQLEPEEQIALLKQLPAGLRDAVLRGVESVKQIPEKVAAATPESAGQFGAQLTAEMLLDPVRVGKGAPKSEIMKKPGGNWEAGSVEQVLDRLRPRGPTNRDEALFLGGRWTQDADTPEGQKRISENAAMSDWLDKKLKNYIRNDMATERDPVRLGIEQRLARAEEEKAKADLRNAKTREKISAARAQGKNTTAAERQLEQDIADAEQNYRLNQIAASHMRLDPQTIAANQQPSEALMNRRIAAGAPPENLATTGLSTFWEKRADLILGIPKNAGDAVSPNFWLEPEDYEHFMRNNSWALKVPPDTKIYSIHNSERTLQFDHLRDELEFALYDRANLPPELRLTPEDLSKMNMDAAVAHVGKMNAWRERNKVAADLLKSRNAATVTFKEYPEAGLEWKELKMPTDQAKDVEKMVTQIEGKYSILPPGERLSWKDPASGRVLFETPEKAIQAYSSNANRSVLEEALGYEGDVMGHCVGGRGYCDKITSGTGRIFSLRDAKGEPHVTIEVEIGDKPVLNKETVREILTPEEKTRYFDASYDPRATNLVNQLKVAGLYDQVADRLKLNEPPLLNILQIKGKNNLKPADKYLPFVQDFVRSQKWGQVKDIKNTGLRRPIELSKNDLNSLRLNEEEFANAFVGRSTDYLTDEEILQIAKEYKSSNSPPQFADGGAVKPAAQSKMGYNAAAVDAIVQRLSEKLNG